MKTFAKHLCLYRINPDFAILEDGEEKWLYDYDDDTMRKLKAIYCENHWVVSQFLVSFVGLVDNYFFKTEGFEAEVNPFGYCSVAPVFDEILPTDNMEMNSSKNDFVDSLLFKNEPKYLKELGRFVQFDVNLFLISDKTGFYAKFDDKKQLTEYIYEVPECDNENDFYNNYDLKQYYIPSIQKMCFIATIKAKVSIYNTFTKKEEYKNSNDIPYEYSEFLEHIENEYCPKWKELEFFELGYAKVVDFDNSIFYIDTRGNRFYVDVKKCKPFNDRYFIFEEKDKKGLINRNNKVILPCKFDEIINDINNNVIAFQNDDRPVKAVINKDGILLVDELDF